jgi:GGDEF domain-containing protein
MVSVAAAVRATLATIGVVAAIYRDGVIVLILPDYSGALALELGERLRGAVARLRIANPEAIAAHHLTASVIAITGKAGDGKDRIQLLTRAIKSLSQISASGGDRVVSKCA